MTPTPTLPQRIIAAVAFSDHDDEDLRTASSDVDRQVIDQARWLAKVTGAELRLLHAIEEPDVDFVDSEGTLHRLLTETVQGEFDKLRDELHTDGIRVTTHIGQGRAPDVIVAEARAWQADTLVVGPHREGYAFVERLLHGSTARRLLREAPASVWVTHVDEPVAPSRLLVAVDLQSEVSSQLVDQAGALGAAAGVPVALLHCMEYPDMLALYRAADHETAVARYRNEARSQALRRCKELLGPARADWAVVLADDSVAGALQRAHANAEADLAVVARTSQPGLAGRVLGSAAERVLHTVEMNTWVIKPDA